MLSLEKERQLVQFAADIRTECINMISKIGVGHVGGCLSLADAFACLYGGAMNVDPQNPRWADRDRIILSKGHAGPVMYAALALKGYFPMEWLDTLNQPPTHLPSHTDMKRTPGVDMTTGSLGQGISSATGIALACRLDGKTNHIFAIVGDGECQEGQVWEAATFAAAQKLDRLIVFVDSNRRQLDGTIEEIAGPQDYAQKFRAFGWHTIDVADGHDIRQVWDAIEQAKTNEQAPTAIILNTIKGKGWQYAEQLENNHNFVVTAELAANAALEFQQQKPL